MHKWNLSVCVFSVMALHFDSLRSHCFLQWSSAGLIVSVVPACRWAYSAFFV